LANYTETLTVYLWEHIDANPGVMIDELVEAMKAAGNIPAASRRMYAASLNGSSKGVSGARGRAPLTHHEPSTVDGDKAARWLVMRMLTQMRRWGSVERDWDGGYQTLRPLKRTGIGAPVTPAYVTHSHAALISVRRQTEKFAAKHPDGKGFMPKALFEALMSYLEASRAEYEARQRDNQSAI
jgi:hypothetical protein